MRRARMSLGGFFVVLYGLIKLVAYAAWCGVGLRRFDPDRASFARAVLLGCLRLAMGLGFGVGIFLGGAFVFAGLHETGVFDPTVAMVATYLAVYVPVRWIEWGLMELIVHPPSRGLAPFLTGADGRTRLWRLGGTLVSCLADVPLMLVAGGVPVGRFMC